jgi:hypothetical protein
VLLLGFSYAAFAAYINITGLAVPLSAGAAFPVPPIKGGDAWL